jgi:AraC-like DNA-binding protein
VAGAQGFAEASDATQLLGPGLRWLERRRHAVWSAGGALIGWAMWSHVGDDDAEDAKQLWLSLAPRMARPYDFILDLRHLASISAGAYDRIREFAHAPKLGLRRHAIIVGEHLAGGTIQLGLYVLKPPAYEWRSFLDYRSTGRWLERADAAAPLAAAERRLAGRERLDAPLRDLRAALAADPAATIDRVARRLGRSRRSLQRELKALATTFSDEVDRARVLRAQELLRDPEWKLDAVAHSIGCADRRSLNRLFRRVCDESPAEFRRRAVT